MRDLLYRGGKRTCILHYNDTTGTIFTHKKAWRTYKTATITNEAMRHALYDMWKELPVAKYEALAASMSKTIKAVLKAKGGLTR